MSGDHRIYFKRCSCGRGTVLVVAQFKSAIFNLPDDLEFVACNVCSQEFEPKFEGSCWEDLKTTLLPVV